MGMGYHFRAGDKVYLHAAVGGSSFSGVVGLDRVGVAHFKRNHDEVFADLAEEPIIDGVVALVRQIHIVLG